MNKLKQKLKNSACVGFRSNKEDCNTSNFSEVQTVDSGIVSDQSSRQENQQPQQEPVKLFSTSRSRKSVPLRGLDNYDDHISKPTHNLSPITENTISNCYQIRNNHQRPLIDFGPTHPYMIAVPYYKYQHSDAYNSVASSSTDDTQSVHSDLFIPSRKVHRKREDHSKNPIDTSSAVRSQIEDPRWDRLPSKLLIRIFKYLSIGDISKSSQVCINWYFIAWQPALWDVIDLCKYSRERRSSDVNGAMRNVFSLLGGIKNPMCPLVHTIKLDKCTMVTDESVILISKSCQNLRTLSLRKCYLISNIALFHILSECRLLTKLNVEGCKLVSSINTLPDSGPTDERTFPLSELNLSYCPLIDDASLSILTYKFPNLRKLLIRSCRRVTTVGLEYIARYCSQMSELSLNNLPLITDDAIISLALKLNSNLQYLSLANCPAITDRSLSHLADNCHQLRYLNLHKCRHVSDSGVMSLAISIQSSLVSLSLSYCDNISNKSLSVISRYCPSIQQLDLNHCVNISDNGLEEACRHLQKLTMINIDNTSVTVRSLECLSQTFAKCNVHYNFVTDC